MKSLVSIIIPTYNRAHLIGETINSVLAQTYQNWECIVVDDGSTDATKEIMEFYCEKNFKVQFYHRPISRKKGASACRNYGLEQAKGEYIQFLDSDDLMGRYKIELQLKIFDENPNCSIVTCRWGRFTSRTKDAIIFDHLEVYNSFSSSYDFLNALANSKGYFPIHAYIFRKKLLRKVGQWNENLNLNDDTEFMVRIVANAKEIHFEPNETVYYRWPINNNLGGFNNQKKVQNAINSWKLIDAYLKIRYKKEEIYFVEQAKSVFFINLKESFPILIKMNKGFFRAQIAKEPSSLRMFLYKLTKKIKKKW